MTQQDDWRPEMARLAQRQDQLERQQRDSTRKVEALQRDGDALKRDVDRRMDSLRRDIDWQFRDGERRVSSLERSRDNLEIPYFIVYSPHRRRRRDHRPGHRGHSVPGAAPGTRRARAAFAFIDLTLPWPVPGVPCNRGLLLPGHLSGKLTAPTASTPPGQPWPAVPGTSFFQSFNR